MLRHHHDANAVTVKPGSKKTLIWTFTTPGRLQFACDLPGHYEAGMHGQITVDITVSKGRTDGSAG